MTHTTANSERDREVDIFLHLLGRALVEGDALTVSTMYETPALVLADAGVQAIARREEIERFFAGAREQYHRRGVTMTRPEVEQREWVGEKVVLVRVRWPYVSAEGRELGGERSTYALRRDDTGALRIRAVLAHSPTTGND